MSEQEWSRFQEEWLHDPDLDLALDTSRVAWTQAERRRLEKQLEPAFDEMARLEDGERVNTDEDRQVGHYWLRDPDRAPDPETAESIRDTVAAIGKLARDVADGRVAPPEGGRFRRLLHIGIGGSALGPQLASEALPGGGLDPVFMDNTDPDGFDRAFAALGADMPVTLVVVVSKSGGTRETRNGLEETAAAFRRAGHELAPRAVAVTGPGSKLDLQAREEGWLARLPLPEWAGGRTSQTAAVGLLPLALTGGDVEAFLAGARRMDAWTRERSAEGNPAARLALAWRHLAGSGTRRAMVVLPYKDRLQLLSRYLQQLVMESLGKERDRQGRIVHEGLTVYGNKGSTDQHAYVQQLREGPDDFFVTFVEVLTDRAGPSPALSDGFTSGDCLQGFLRGTREALWEQGRSSLTLTLGRLDETALGAVIALFERAVGLYAGMIGINAYHQPGVEAGKQAAAGVLELQRAVVAALPDDGWVSAAAAAAAAGRDGEAETAFHILRHLAANADRGVAARPAARPGDWLFGRRRSGT